MRPSSSTYLGSGGQGIKVSNGAAISHQFNGPILSVSQNVSSSRPRFSTPAGTNAPVSMSQPFMANVQHTTTSPNGSFSASPPSASRLGTINPSYQNVSPSHLSVQGIGTPDIVVARRVPASSVPQQRQQVTQQFFESQQQRSPSAGRSGGVSGLRSTSAATNRAPSPSLLAGTKASANRREATQRQMMASDAMRRRVRMVDSGHMPPSETSAFTNNRLMGWGVGLTSSHKDQEIPVANEARSSSQPAARATSPSATRSQKTPAWNGDVRVVESFKSDSEGHERPSNYPYTSRHNTLHDQSTNASRTASRSSTPTPQAVRGTGRSRKFQESSLAAATNSYQNAFTPSDYHDVSAIGGGVLGTDTADGARRRSPSPSVSVSSPQPPASRTASSASIVAERDHFKTVALQCRQVIEAQVWKIEQLEKQLATSSNNNIITPAAPEVEPPKTVKSTSFNHLGVQTHFDDIDLSKEEAQDSKKEKGISAEEHEILLAAHADAMHKLQLQLQTLESENNALKADAIKAKAIYDDNLKAMMSTIESLEATLQTTTSQLNEKERVYETERKQLVHSIALLEENAKRSQTLITELEAATQKISSAKEPPSTTKNIEVETDEPNSKPSTHSVAELEEDIQFILGCINDLVEWAKVQHHDNGDNDYDSATSSLPPFVPRTAIITGKTLTSNQYSAQLKTFLDNQQSLSDAFQHICHVNEKEHRRRIEVEDALQKGIMALEEVSAREQAATKALEEHFRQAKAVEKKVNVLSNKVSTATSDENNNSIYRQRFEAFEMLQRPTFIAATESEKEALFLAFQEDLDRQRLQLLAQHDEEVRGVRAAWEVEDLRLREEIMRLEKILQTAELLSKKDSDTRQEHVTIPPVEQNKVVSDLENEIRKLKSELGAVSATVHTKPQPEAGTQSFEDHAKAIAAMTVEIKVAKAQIATLEEKLRLSEQAVNFATASKIEAMEEASREAIAATSTSNAVILLQEECQKLRQVLTDKAAEYQKSQDIISGLEGNNTKAAQGLQVESDANNLSLVTDQLAKATQDLNEAKAALAAEQKNSEAERLSFAQSQEEYSRVIFELRTAKLELESALADAKEASIKNNEIDTTVEKSNNAEEGDLLETISKLKDKISSQALEHQATLEKALLDQQHSLEESHRNALLAEEEEWNARFKAQEARQTDAVAKKVQQAVRELETELQTLRGQLATSEESLSANEALLDALRAETIELKSQIANLEEQLASAPQLNEVAKLAESEEKLQSLREEVATKEAQATQQRETIAALQNANEILEVSNQGLTQSLTEVNASLKKVINEKSELETQLAVDSKKVTEAKAEAEDLRTKLAQIAVSLMEAEAERKSLATSVEELSAQLKQSQADFERVNSEAVNQGDTPTLLSSTAAELTSASGTHILRDSGHHGIDEEGESRIVSRLAAQVRHLESQVVGLQSEKQKLEQQLQMADAEREELAEELEYAAIAVKSHLTTPRANDGSGSIPAPIVEGHADEPAYGSGIAAESTTSNASRALSYASQYLEQEF